MNRLFWMQKILISTFLIFLGFSPGVSFSAEEEKTSEPTASQEAEKPDKEEAKDKPKRRPDVIISEVAGYDKGFYIKSPDGNSSLKISGYIQPYYILVLREHQDSTNTFRVRRARMKFLGHLYTPNLGYVIEYEFGGNKLLAAYMRYFFADEFVITGGQFRVPHNKEGLSSASTLQFVDRSELHGIFGYKDEREPGLMLSGKVAKGFFEYMAAVTNGEGLNLQSENSELRYAIRLNLNPLRGIGKSFGDVKSSRKPKFQIGVGVNYNDTPEPNAGAFEEKVLNGVVDATFWYKGFSLHGAGFYRHTNPDVGAKRTDSGFLAQAGYFVVPKKLEIVSRVGRGFLDAANDIGEYTLGFNWHIFGSHKVKLQTDYDLLTEKNRVAPGNDAIDHQVRMQLQLKI